jgi:hypothetical protein
VAHTASGSTAHPRHSSSLQHSSTHSIVTPRPLPNTLKDLPTPTWKDIIIILRDTMSESSIFNNTTDIRSAHTSTFAPTEFYSDKLPSQLCLVNQLPEKMLRHFNHILATHYPAQVASTEYPVFNGTTFTPSYPLQQLQTSCRRVTLILNQESTANDIALHVYEVVYDIYFALRLKRLRFRREVCGEHDTVRTHRAFFVDSTFKIL